MIQKAWRNLMAQLGSTFEDDPETAKRLCAEYAHAVLKTRDAQRIARLGMPQLKAVAQGALEGRKLMAFAMLVRACERQGTKSKLRPRSH